MFMYVVLRVPVGELQLEDESGNIIEFLNEAMPIGVFASKTQAEQCLSADRKRAPSLFIKMGQDQWPCRFIWQVYPLPQPIDWHPKSGDTVYVSTQENSLIGCQQYLPQDLGEVNGNLGASVSVPRTKIHTLKFNMYKPGILSDTHMHICPVGSLHSQSDCNPEKGQSKLKF